MKKYILTALAFILASFAIYVTYRHLNSSNNQVKAAPGELVETKEERNAINKWLKTSGDAIAMGVQNNDPAALWIQGMFLLTGSAGWPIDSQTATILFAKSASLGFAPSLNQLRLMYAAEEQNGYLALVYINLTASAEHPEMLTLYEEIKSDLLSLSGTLGMTIIKEVEKIACYKQTRIARLKSKMKNNRNAIYLEGLITDEDVLFDHDFWTHIIDGSLVTGNLQDWLNSSENYCRKLELLAQKARDTEDRLASYRDIDKGTEDEQ